MECRANWMARPCRPPNAPRRPGVRTTGRPDATAAREERPPCVVRGRRQKRMASRLQISRRRRASRWRSALLIVGNEFMDRGREMHPLPLPFLGFEMQEGLANSYAGDLDRTGPRTLVRQSGLS